jgi:UDP-2,3-diacylglucosamine pyrophosphatase LpxH
MTAQNFMQAEHTLVLSDIHLADAEPVHPHNPLWKKFKQAKYFIDPTFKAFLDHMRAQIQSPIELVLNGDIFDFDSVMGLPADKEIRISWIERLRGLSSEEQKSRYKMKMILDAHTCWLNTMREFLLAGNRAVFIIGNHDMELHWPSVQQDFIFRLDLPEESKSLVRFCEWFYISNQDTLIEHGNQYDAYCLCSNPIHPLIKKGSKVIVRLPFGNLAGKYMVNGIGLMNPHANSSFIKSSVWEYIGFYCKYMLRIQPLLVWTWIWGAMATLVYSLREGFLPALRDPLTVDARIQDVALRANAPVLVVLALKEVHVHPAIFDPLKILRELWLDRAILLVIIVLGSFQFFSVMNVFSKVSFWWFVVPVALLMPLFIFYARSVQSEVDATQKAAFNLAPLSARITKVRRIVQGHTHLEGHSSADGVEVLNTGTWSPAYEDVECTQPYGRKCFAWIRPTSFKLTNSAVTERIADLYEWRDSAPFLIPKQV